MNRNRILTALALAAALALPLSVAAASTTPATNPAKSATPAVKKSVHHPTSAKVDINTATRAELAGVPGIGEPVADKIIAARPFTSRTQLLSRKIVSHAAYTRIAPHVIARQPLASK
jgi:DNA uptake protein ComE-like DNA-binding protein